MGRTRSRAWTSVAAVALATLAAPRPARAADVRLALDAEDATWHRVRLVPDGVAGKAASFDHPDAHVDVRPFAFPVEASRPFTLIAHLRTRDPGFSTALIARNGGRVGLSLVMGREPGKVSFEAWSWQTVRLVSRRRIDDGAWHRIEVPYDPRTRTAVLMVDGVPQVAADLGPSPGLPAPLDLRLGDNLGAHQPYRGDLDEVEVVGRVLHPELLAVLAPVVPEEERRRDLSDLRDRLLPAATPDPGDAVAWGLRRDRIRAGIADALGLDPRPPAGPTEPAVHGRLEGEGFEVRRTSWASWPAYRATGWLWLPRPMPPGRRPAVLSPHGHWAGGAIDPVVQTRAIRLAREGYVVLVPDAVHVEDVASGVSAAGVMAWNNLRGLDLLAERDDVDPARIAVTGASGGGMQTMHLMAVSDRIAAAAPICMVSHFREILPIDGAHCTCNHAPRLAFVADQPEICATFAPRPAFYGSVTGDWTASFPRDGLPAIRRVYRLLGHPDAVANLHRDEGHGYGREFREAVYAFFGAALRGAPGPVSEGEVVTVPRQRLLALGPAPGVPPDRAALAREFVARRGGRTLRDVAPGLPWEVASAPLEEEGATTAASGWRRASVRAPDGVRIPLLLRERPSAPGEPWLVVAPSDGMAALASAPPPWLETRGRVALVDVRWRGEWSRFAEAGRRNGLLLGRGEGYQAAHDLALVCASLPAPRPGARAAPSPTGATVVGLGPNGVVALLAAGITPTIGGVIAPDLGPRFAEDGNRAPLCPEILRFGDLPRLPGAIRAERDVTRTLVLGGARGRQDYAVPVGVDLQVSEGPLRPEEIDRAVRDTR